MRVELLRTASNEDGTFGTFNIDGQPICVTLEETWLNNQRRISCIPAGEYECEKYSGTKYKDVWIVKEVPGRTAILLHWGNTELNTAGCLLFGRNFSKFGSKWGIGRSREAFEILRKVLPDKFTLTIYDCFMKQPGIFTKPKAPTFWERFLKRLDTLGE